MSLETAEISLQKLLSLVAERLIDSNSNVEVRTLGKLGNLSFPPSLLLFLLFGIGVDRVGVCVWEG